VAEGIEQVGGAAVEHVGGLAYDPAPAAIALANTASTSGTRWMVTGVPPEGPGPRTTISGCSSASMIRAVADRDLGVTDPAARSASCSVPRRRTLAVELDGLRGVADRWVRSPPGPPRRSSPAWPCPLAFALLPVFALLVLRLLCFALSA
jgi:hypothetical protein